MLEGTALRATVSTEAIVGQAPLPREDARDAFIGKVARSIAEMPESSIVGSSSLRRQALIRRLRPDLRVEMFRGNVQTRLRKLEEGVAGGRILAMAGLYSDGPLAGFSGWPFLMALLATGAVVALTNRARRHGGA